MKTNTRLRVIAAILISAASARAAGSAVEPNAPVSPALAALEPVQVAAIRCDFAVGHKSAPWLAIERSVEKHLQDANVPVIPIVYVGRRVMQPDKPLYTVKACLLGSQDSRSYVCHLTSSLSITAADPKSPARTFTAQVWQSEPAMLYVTADKLVSTVTQTAIEQADAFSAACRKAERSAAAAPQAQPATTTRAAEPVTTAEATQAHAFVASKNSNVYHRPTCPSAKRISVGNLVGYATREQAEATGKRSCKRCQP